MIDVRNIPDYAICHKCGQPMKVVELGPQAARLGVKIPDGSYVIECCGHELTIDDEPARLALKNLLLAYHGQEASAQRSETGSGTVHAGS